jgi:hypothetical protein
MKSSLLSKIILAVLALGLTAFAADTHKSSFEISQPAQVNGTQIPAGEYTAKWEGSGPAVQVSIMKGKKVLATVPAQVVALDSPVSGTQAELTKSGNGNPELTALKFSGKKYSLALGTQSASEQKPTN